MRNIDLSIVVCTRNRSDMLRSCLLHLVALQVDCGWEIVVVDNGSRDATAQVVAAIREGNAHVELVQESRAGLGRARNTGWRASSGKVIAFTDDDCYPAQDWLKEIARCFEDERFGWVAGAIALYDPDDAPETITHLEERKLYPPYKVLVDGDFHGANFAFRRDVLEAIGGFDDDLGAGTAFVCEDLDACVRAIFAGTWGLFDPKPLVYHHHRRKVADTGPLFIQYARGRGAFYAKLILRRQTRAIYSRRLLIHLAGVVRLRKRAVRDRVHLIRGLISYSRAHFRRERGSSKGELSPT